MRSHALSFTIGKAKDSKNVRALPSLKIGGALVSTRVLNRTWRVEVAGGSSIKTGICNCKRRRLRSRSLNCETSDVQPVWSCAEGEKQTRLVLG